ncbi:MAG: amidohydrolase [Lentisphaeria bacterium]|nr:amidohydrolase [Lentisphaeria bacterium]
MIIDSHVHFPASLDIPEKEWGKYLVDRAARCGIDAVIVSDVFIRNSNDAGAYPDSAALRRANGYAAGQAALNPGRLYFLAYINPQEPDWQREADLAVADGAVGIKLWISLKDDSSSMAATAEVLRYASRRNLPVLLHVFNRTEGNLKGEINIAEFAELSRQVPECIMIAAHSGGNYHVSAGMYKRCSGNVYWDISGTDPDRSMVTELLKEVPAERLLFGSDAPGRSFVSQLHKVTLARIPEPEKKLILGKNAQKLYKIHDIAQTPPSTIDKTEPEINLCSEDHFLFCGKWPFSSAENITPKKLEHLLETNNIDRGFTVDLDSVFSIDLLYANRKFRHQCRRYRRILPLAVVDPESANLEVLLDDAAEHNDRGVWFSPALSSRMPDSTPVLKLCALCAERKLPLYMNCSLGEARFQHRALHIKRIFFNDLRNFFKVAPEHDYIFQGIVPEPDIPRHDCRFTFEKLTDSEQGITNFINSGGSKEYLLPGSEFPFREINQTRLAAAGKIF